MVNVGKYTIHGSYGSPKPHMFSHLKSLGIPPGSLEIPSLEFPP